ncbi:MAG: hypothetical protein AAGA45_07360 [Verrucomicrobiota bacterium]
MSTLLRKLAGIVCCLMACATASAGIFNINFFNGSGGFIGSGTYAFNAIAEDTNTAFDDLTGLTWSFDIPVYGINIASAAGDSSTRVSTADEGVYTTVISSNLQLRFYDDVGTFISHNDESALPSRTSVRFVEFSDAVEYIKDDVTVDTGSFTTTFVPEPSVYGIVMGLLVLAVAVIRFRATRT